MANGRKSAADAAVRPSPHRVPRPVRAVSRALAILQSFEQEPWQELRAVAERSRLDKATARRLLLTLMADGFVVQDERSQSYGLGGAVRRLASSAPDHDDLRRAATPILDQLATELRVTTFLSIYRDHGALCIDRFHDMHGMEVRWWSVGGILPFNCGGAPKLLLALQDETEIEMVLNQPPTALTPKSIMDMDILRKRLRLVRKQGYEFAVDDVAVGLTALAVPVYDRKPALLGAVSMAGLTPQMIERKRPKFLDRLRKAAHDVEARLS